MADRQSDGPEEQRKLLWVLPLLQDVVGKPHKRDKKVRFVKGHQQPILILSHSGFPLLAASGNHDLFSTPPTPLSHTHTYKMETLTGTHQCIHTFSPTHMQTNPHNPPVNDEVSLLQGERGRDGDLGSPGVPVSVESFCFHWVAAELMFSNAVFKMCVSCVCVCTVT